MSDGGRFGAGRDGHRICQSNRGGQNPDRQKGGWTRSTSKSKRDDLLTVTALTLETGQGGCAKGTGWSRDTSGKRRKGTPMDTLNVERIQADPTYQKLKRERSRFGWTLTILMLIVYYGYILVIAFKPGILAARMGAGVMTWGIPIGFGVIVFTILITAYYVRRANSEFDDLTDQIKREVLK